MPRAEQYIIPPVDLILVAAGAVTTETPLPSGCRGLLVGTAGSLNVTINDSAKTSVPFLQGINPGFFQSVQASPSGAQDIWAIV